jgi:3-oxoacyl-[acyl-carrier protein] reductase
MERGEFQGKVAAVTGASGGIGGTTARLLALRGASVALLDLSDTTRIADSLSKEFGI